MLRHPTAVRWQPIRPRSPIAASPTEGAACACASARPTRQPAAPPPSPAAPRRRRGVRRRRPRHRRHGQRSTAPTTAGTVRPRHGTATVVAGNPSPTTAAPPTDAAGTITLPLRASTSRPRRRSIDVFVAEQRGYYDELCLDVELTPSFSTANYPLVAAGEAQFASGGSFSEVVDFAAANDAELVAVVVEGRTPDRRADPQAGHGDDARRPRAATTIGVKGKITAERRGDARRRRPRRGRRLRDGAARRLRPGRPRSPSTASSASPATRATSRARSSAPASPFDLFDPTDYDVPGSFGVIYTTRSFLERAPDRGAGLRAGDDARARRRDRRPGRRGADRARPDRGQRQPELPLAGGRDVPLADRSADLHRRLRRRRRGLRRARPRPCCRPRSTPTTPSACSATPARTRRPTSPR